MSRSSGDVALTLMRMYPTEFAAAPFASGVPTVRKLDDCTGGLQDGNASGAPWVLLPGAAHCLYAGTSETRSGVAPLGRGWVAPASCANEMTASPAIAETAKRR